MVDPELDSCSCSTCDGAKGEGQKALGKSETGTGFRRAARGAHREHQRCIAHEDGEEVAGKALKDPHTWCQVIALNVRHGGEWPEPGVARGVRLARRHDLHKPTQHSRRDANFLPPLGGDTGCET